MLKDLPVIIDGPGDYTTRNGRRVTIHAIKGPSTFAAKGSIWKHKDRMGTNPDYGIWHVSGRFVFVGEHSLDIVKKI